MFRIGVKLNLAFNLLFFAGPCPTTPQKFGHGASLQGNCYLENKFPKKSRLKPLPLRQQQHFSHDKY